MNDRTASIIKKMPHQQPAPQPTFWDDFDVLFRDFFDTRSKFSQIPQTHFTYPVDIISKQNGININIAIVGVEKKDVQIFMEDDVLRVSYKHPDVPENKDETYIQRGITRRSFDFAWKLSSKLDSKNINATMDKGILSIAILYKADKEKRNIEIV